MEIDIIGRHLGITDRFREYATEKSEKVSHLAPRAISFEVKVVRQRETNSNDTERVELTLVGPGPLVRAEAAGADKYAAFDVALTRLLERVRRAKDRRKVHRGGGHRPISLHDAATGSFSVVDITPADIDAMNRANGKSVAAATATATAEAEPGEEEYCPVVIRHKVFAAEPMTVDDALYYMELVGHDFYLFIDQETRRPSVVYRRKGWDYGVIALDAEADELQEAASARRH